MYVHDEKYLVLGRRTITKLLLSVLEDASHTSYDFITIPKLLNSNSYVNLYTLYVRDESI